MRLQTEKHTRLQRYGRKQEWQSFFMLLVALTFSKNSYTDAFVLEHRRPSTPQESALLSSRRLAFILTATRDEQQTSTSEGTWSRSAEKPRSESRFGVRRRVKAVLRKARNRTGVLNLNTEQQDETSPGSIVADAASIGGWEDDQDANLVFRKQNGWKPQNSTDSLILESSSTTSASSPLNSSTDNEGEENDKKDDSSGGSQVDAILNTEQQEPYHIEPLPFTLPTLTDEQRQLLLQGERIQEQSKMGREGSGYVVVDVKAPPYVVWECLLDFEAYPEYIGTVRSMRMFTNTHLKSSYIAEKPVLPGTGRETRHYGTASITRASFVLSKFRLKIAAIHKYRPHPDGHYMVFDLDRACKNVVMQDAKGIWYTQSNPDGRGEEYTRVWLFCEVKVSSLLPRWIVDYAAKRAMPRATTWLKPLVQEQAEKWLSEKE